MSVQANATNPRRGSDHRRMGGRECTGGAGVLTQEPSAICRAPDRPVGTHRRPINPVVSRTFAGRCAVEGVALRRPFDTLRHACNLSNYQVILDRRRVLESAWPLPGRTELRQGADARVIAAGSCACKSVTIHAFPTSRFGHEAVAWRRQAQESTNRAWYVDCISRPRGPTEGEEIQ